MRKTLIGNQRYPNLTRKENIQASSIIPQHLRKKEELLAAMLFIQELGLPIMSGLQNIAVINGKPTLNSHLLWALVMKQTDLKKVNVDSSDPTKCEVEISRSTGTSKASFSIEDAKKAGLIRSGSGWEKYPKQMLEARAKSLCARLAYPEALFGIYSTEELRDAEPFNNREPQEIKATIKETKNSEQLEERKEAVALEKAVLQKKKDIAELIKTHLAITEKEEIKKFIAKCQEDAGIENLDSLENICSLETYIMETIEIAHSNADIDTKALEKGIENAPKPMIKETHELDEIGEDLFDGEESNGGYGND